MISNKHLLLHFFSFPFAYCPVPMKGWQVQTPTKDTPEPLAGLLWQLLERERAPKSLWEAIFCRERLSRGFSRLVALGHACVAWSAANNLGQIPQKKRSSESLVLRSQGSLVSRGRRGREIARLRPLAAVVAANFQKSIANAIFFGRRRGQKPCDFCNGMIASPLAAAVVAAICDASFVPLRASPCRTPSASWIRLYFVHTHYPSPKPDFVTTIVGEAGNPTHFPALPLYPIWLQTANVSEGKFQLHIQNRAARRMNFHYRDRSVGHFSRNLILRIQILPWTPDFGLETNLFCNDVGDDANRSQCWSFQQERPGNLTPILWLLLGSYLHTSLSSERVLDASQLFWSEMTAHVSETPKLR